MHGTLQRRVQEAREVERAIVQGTARLCSPNFGKVCKALWPLKTAEHLAAIIGCSVRAAAYEISGDREPSAQSILAVLDAITPKRERNGNGSAGGITGAARGAQGAPGSHGRSQE